MAQDQIPFFPWCRWIDNFIRSEVAFGLIENPRRTHGGAADHDAGNSRSTAPFHDVLRTGDIAIPDHRNGYGGRDFADHIPIGRAEITLRRRSAVDGQGGNSLVD